MKFTVFLSFVAGLCLFSAPAFSLNYECSVDQAGAEQALGQFEIDTSRADVQGVKVNANTFGVCQSFDDQETEATFLACGFVEVDSKDASVENLQIQTSLTPNAANRTIAASLVLESAGFTAIQASFAQSTFAVSCISR